jgi:FixJ family two-component response regulator
VAKTDPMTLAIVDDDDDVRRALSRLLRAMGYDVKVFTSAEEFEAETVAVDCAIVDVRLPGVSGLELRERLRNRIAPTPVVLITGDGDRLARDIPRSIDTPLVTKPFDDAVLTAAITAAISMAESLRERHAP